MACNREKIERFEIKWLDRESFPWKHPSKSRKWRKKQMNRFIRRNGKHVEDDDRGYKLGRKPYKGWEW